MFNIGDFVFDTIAGANVQIMERIELWGYTSYKVFNPANGSVYKATGEQLKRGAVKHSWMRTTCAMLRCSQKSETRHLPVFFLLSPAA